MSDVVLSQLVEAESQLTAELTGLSTQLEAIQEKRKGLQTVIDMFQSSGGNGAAISTASISTASLPKSAQRSPGPKPKSSPASSKTTKKTASKVTATSAKKTSTKTSTPRRSKGGKAPNWLRYVQEPFRKTPLPDVVANVLNAQPDDVFKIVDVMEAVFKPDMPKAAFLKARNRVSNILSAGARNKEWYRGRAGRYSLSKKVLKI